MRVRLGQFLAWLTAVALTWAAPAWAEEMDQLVFRDGSVAEGRVEELRYGVYRFLDVESGASRWVACPELRFVIYGNGARARQFLGMTERSVHCPDLCLGDVRLLPAAAHRRQAVEAIRGAAQSVYLMTFRLADEGQDAVAEVLAALRERARAGVESCLLLPGAMRQRFQETSRSREAAEILAADGVEIRVIDGGAVPHQNLLIADRRILCMGSSDLTAGGLEDQLEWNLVSEHPTLVQAAVADFLAGRERSRPLGE
jgi:hypothetical protein